jgi:hypothetical protein
MCPRAEPFDDGGAGSNLFANLSDRAASVVIAMMAEAGRRGADPIDVNDLIIALISEDQDPRAAFLFALEPPGLGALRPAATTGREPLFPPKVATDILTKLDQTLPRSKSIPHGTDQRMAPTLERVLAAAQNLPREFNQRAVQVNHFTRERPRGTYQAVVPLDLLAAALREPCEATQMLQEAGITEEQENISRCSAPVQVLLAGDSDPSFGGLRLKLNIGVAGGGQQVTMLVRREHPDAGLRRIFLHEAGSEGQRAFVDFGDDGELTARPCDAEHLAQVIGKVWPPEVRFDRGDQVERVIRER